MEANIIINKMLAMGRANVITSAQNLNTIYSSPSVDGLKTIVLHNLSTSVDIYFGITSGVTISNAGGIIRHGTSREIPITNLTFGSPFFIASANASMAAEFWG
jgi:hypothetical protein